MLITRKQNPWEFADVDNLAPKRMGDYKTQVSSIDSKPTTQSHRIDPRSTHRANRDLMSSELISKLPKTLNSKPVVEYDASHMIKS